MIKTINRLVAFFDPIRWALGVILIHAIFKEAGVATAIFTSLVFIQNEKWIFQARIQALAFHDMAKNIQAQMIKGDDNDRTTH